MNLWECNYAGCTSTAVGTGGAIGLSAIGWKFSLRGLGRSPELLCPAHRDEQPPCREDGDNLGKPCSTCAGDAEATMIQNAIRDHYEDIRAWEAARKLVESSK